MNLEKTEQFYNKHYRKLMLIPIIALILALISIAALYSTTGEFFHKDISLKGGISARIDTTQEFTEQQIQEALGVKTEIRKLANMATGERLGYIIQTPDLTPDQLRDKLNKNLNLNLIQGKNFSYEETEPRLGAAFYKQLMIAVAFAFLLMAITAFVTFRTPVPSIAIIFAAFTDITVTLAILNLFNVQLSTAGLMTFLMVIGYSIDTDILLTNWAMRKKEGMLFTRFINSMKTGLTMVITTIAAATVALLFSKSEIIKEIFLILLIALIVDVFSTYLTNMGVLKWYCDRKKIT